MEPVIHTKVGQRRIFQDEVLGLREDFLVGPSGVRLHRKVLEYQPASVVLPIDEEGRALLIRHYRHPVARSLWEVPGGMIGADESAEAAAVRETYEETGYRVTSLERLLTFFPEPAFADHRIAVFLGTGLVREGGSGREDEISQARLFTRMEVELLIDEGEIASSWTLVAVLRGLDRLR